MRRIIVKRALLAITALFALIAAGGAGFLVLLRPRVRPPSSEVVARTPERLARGVACHSQPDPERFGMPIPRGAALAGGQLFDRSFGPPGIFQAPNITPDPDTGIGRWTDGELMRAIREGLHRSGRVLFPMMPYPALREMGDEDLRSVVTYLRAATPVKRTTHPIEVNFPFNLLMRAIPAPVTAPVYPPDANDAVAYGGYLVGLAGCRRCHTREKRGQEIAHEAFAGGVEFGIATAAGRFHVVSANITTDPATGYFGRTSKAEWIGRVRSFAALRDDPPRVANGLNTVMLWREYSGLTDADLGSIYDYMRTVSPVKKRVDSFPDAHCPQIATPEALTNTTTITSCAQAAPGGL
jgi:hypothetical protein